MFEVNNRNTRARCKISKLTIKTPERRHWCRSHVFIVNFEHISHFVLLFLFLTLRWEMPAGTVTVELNIRPSVVLLWRPMAFSSHFIVGCKQKIKVESA